MKKFELVYEDDECISIWRYDKSKSSNNPVEVEHKWKKNFNPWSQKKKTLSDIVNEEKKKVR